MNFQTMLQSVRQHPRYCSRCNRVTEFVFQVAKNTGKGQYQGLVCPDCQYYKAVRFIPYKDKKAQDRIWDKDYRKENFR